MKKKTVSGRTLFELILVIVLTTVIATAVSFPVLAGVRLYTQILYWDDAVAQARLGMDRMTRELASARFENTLTGSVDRSMISFSLPLDYGGGTATYRWGGDIPGDPNYHKVLRNGIPIMEKIGRCYFYPDGVSQLALPPSNPDANGEGLLSGVVRVRIYLVPEPFTSLNDPNSVLFHDAAHLRSRTDLVIPPP